MLNSPTVSTIYILYILIKLTFENLAIFIWLKKKKKNKSKCKPNPQDSLKEQSFTRIWKYLITKPGNSDTQLSCLLTISTTHVQIKCKSRCENCKPWRKLYVPCRLRLLAPGCASWEINSSLSSTLTERGTPFFSRHTVVQSPQLEKISRII